MWQVRAEEHDDATQVEALVARSFGPGRYAKSAYRLREGVAQETGLAFVAIEDDSLKGSVRFWPVAVGETRALLLGPLAVETNERGRGIGLALMERGIEEAHSELSPLVDSPRGPAARMSEAICGAHRARAFPDFAALHPGYRRLFPRKRGARDKAHVFSIFQNGMISGIASIPFRLAR